MEPFSLDAFVLIGIALATMFFGYFFGLFEGRGQGYKKRKEEVSEERNAPVALPPVAPPVVVDDPGLLRLKNENNKLRLDVDGQRVDSSVPVSPALRKRLIDLLTLIRPFLEGGQPAPAAPAPAPVSPPAARPTPITPAERVMFTSSTQAPKVEPVPAKIDFSILSRKKEEQPAPLSMIEQIDQILQLKLVNTPLASLGIKIQDVPDGGVVVIVGNNKYEGVGDVPDPEIKSLLQAAVAEWEKKYTPGL